MTHGDLEPLNVNTGLCMAWEVQAIARLVCATSVPDVQLVPRNLPLAKI